MRRGAKWKSLNPIPPRTHQALSPLDPYLGLRDCLRRMVREEGALALYRGMGFRLCYLVPLTAVQVLPLSFFFSSAFPLCRC